MPVVAFPVNAVEIVYADPFNALQNQNMACGEL